MKKRNSQIKSKSRVRDRGEVFTNDREVQAMLDLVRPETYRIDSTFLEPACGNGNFLVAIFERKLTTVFDTTGNNPEACEYLAIRAISTIYGVDIAADNVAESRERLTNQFIEAFRSHHNREPSQSCMDSIRFILNRNIQCGNALTNSNDDGTDLVITGWHFQMDYLTISLTKLSDMAATGCKCHPFMTFPRIHYTDLPSFARSYDSVFTSEK